MGWVALGAVLLLVAVLVVRDLRRKPDATALPRPGHHRTPDGHQVSEDRAWDTARPPSVNHQQGPGAGGF